MIHLIFMLRWIWLAGHTVRVISRQDSIKDATNASLIFICTHLAVTFELNKIGNVYLVVVVYKNFKGL